MEEECIRLRLWISGMKGVGKMSIMKRYVNNTFDRVNSSTIRMDFMFKNIFINEKKIRLHIHNDDEKRYKLKTIFLNYCSIEAFIIVFDVSNKQSFLEAIELLYDHKAELVKHINKNHEHNTKYSCCSKLFVLLANKCDCENRIITTEEAKKQAEELEAIYAETSAKTGYGINKIFKEIITKRIEYYEIMRKEKILKKKSKPSLCAIL